MRHLSGPRRFRSLLRFPASRMYRVNQPYVRPTSHFRGGISKPRPATARASRTGCAAAPPPISEAVKLTMRKCSLASTAMRRFRPAPCATAHQGGVMNRLEQKAPEPPMLRAPRRQASLLRPVAPAGGNSGPIAILPQRSGPRKAFRLPLNTGHPAAVRWQPHKKRDSQPNSYAGC
jgi:hypothetical protein